MPHQENPNIRFVNVRCSQELYRRAELEANNRKMSNVSAFVRSLIVKATRNVEFTQADDMLIKKRTSERRIKNATAVHENQRNRFARKMEK